MEREAKEYHDVAVIPGDLNGVTVTHAVLGLYDYIEPALGKPIKHTRYEYDASYFREREMTELGDEELEQLVRHDQIFLGAVGDDTKIKRGTLENGILLRIRQAFDQYVNLRPVVLFPGVRSVILGKGSDDINYEILRENTEGLYINRGWLENEGTDDEVAYQLLKCSYKGIRRLAEFAVDRARKRQRPGFEKPRVHFVFKSNIMTKAATIWDRVQDEVEKANPDIDIEYMHVDAFIMQMVLHPEWFDVVLTSNMFGDICTDLGAVLQGGIGSAVSGNINPTGEFPSMFEPIHGSAPDKWFRNPKDSSTYDPELVQLIQPEAAFLSYSMMLGYLGEERASKLVEEAALTNLRDPHYDEKTLDQLVDQARKTISRSALAV
jgi:3-isopropylmalate dehydrogenase